VRSNYVSNALSFAQALLHKDFFFFCVQRAKAPGTEGGIIEKEENMQKGVFRNEEENTGNNQENKAKTLEELWRTVTFEKMVRLRGKVVKIEEEVEIFHLREE